MVQLAFHCLLKPLRVSLRVGMFRLLVKKLFLVFIKKKDLWVQSVF